MDKSTIAQRGEALLIQIASTLRVSGYPWKIGPAGYEVDLRDGSGRFVVTADGEVMFFPSSLQSFAVSTEFRGVLNVISRTLNDSNRASFAVMEPW